MRLAWCAPLLFAITCFGEAPTFEVASVKIAVEDKSAPFEGMFSMTGGPGTADPDQIHYKNVPLKMLFLTAFNIKTFQGVTPNWMEDQRFDIHAKLPIGATQEQFRLMLQALLTERFGMQAHRESRDDLPELAVGARGIRYFPLPGRRIRYSARAQTLESLVNLTQNRIGHLVVDKTGLSGLYDFNLDFSPGVAGSESTANTDENGVPFLFAMQSLGLKLQSTKAPVEMVVIDRIEKTPTEN